MDKVDMEYKFYLVGSKAQSSYKTMSEHAWEKAREFFGDRQKFRVSVEVSGRSDNYTVECRAQADVEVEGGNGT